MRHRLLIALLACVSAATSAAAQGSLETFVIKQVVGGRYMSPAGGCAASTKDLFNWPKAELQRCVYAVADVFVDGTKRNRKAVVYLANPEPAHVLAWLRTACTLARPMAVDACIRSQASAIRGASGAQFAVAGLVLEDLACGHPRGKCKFVNGDPVGDGVQENYIFRNGVTVRISALANGSTDPVATDDALEALASAQEVTGVRSSGGFARILSTSREQFQRHTGRTDIPVGKGDAAAAIAWSDIVGVTYRAALSSDSNPLITAAVCDAFHFPAACTPH